MIENNLIVFMHLAVVRITSFGIEESFLALITFIGSYIGCVCVCGGCWLLLGCLFPVCQTNRLVCLLLPPTLMLPLIVLICP